MIVFKTLLIYINNLIDTNRSHFKSDIFALSSIMCASNWIIGVRSIPSHHYSLHFLLLKHIYDLNLMNIDVTIYVMMCGILKWFCAFLIFFLFRFINTRLVNRCVLDFSTIFVLLVLKWCLWACCRILRQWSSVLLPKIQWYFSFWRNQRIVAVISAYTLIYLEIIKDVFINVLIISGCGLKWNWIIVWLHSCQIFDENKDSKYLYYIIYEDVCYLKFESFKT